MLRPGERRRRCVLLVAVAVAALLGGCGGGDGVSWTDESKESDAEMLNSVLAQELTLKSFYKRGMPLLKGEARAAAMKFKAQDEEYIDAISKALRGLGKGASAELEELDFDTVLDAKSMLVLAYELESAALASAHAIEPHLFTPAPRSFVAGIAVGHGQHLVVLRELLGERPSKSVPEAFDGGDAPLPEGIAPSDPSVRPEQ